MKDLFGRCGACGQGELDISVVPDPFLLVNDDLGTYCSNCGELLYETCFSCSGSGLTSLFGHDRYCSACGRKVDNSCGSCGGKGRILKKHHFCSSRY